MMIRKNHFPFAALAPQDAPAVRYWINLGSPSSVGVNARIHRIGQHLIDDVIAWLPPTDDPANTSDLALRGQFQALTRQVIEHTSHRAKLLEEGETEFNRMSHTLIRIQSDLSTESIILQTNGHIPDQIATLCFVESPTHHARFDLVKLYL